MKLDVLATLSLSVINVRAELIVPNLYGGSHCIMYEAQEHNSNSGNSSSLLNRTIVGISMFLWLGKLFRCSSNQWTRTRLQTRTRIRRSVGRCRLLVVASVYTIRTKRICSSKLFPTIVVDTSLGWWSTFQAFIVRHRYASQLLKCEKDLLNILIHLCRTFHYLMMVNDNDDKMMMNGRSFFNFNYIIVCLSICASINPSINHVAHIFHIFPIEMHQSTTIIFCQTYFCTKFGQFTKDPFGHIFFQNDSFL